MKIDPYCQRQRRCNSLNVLFNIVFLALICRRCFHQAPSYTHCCRALTLALARLSRIFLVSSDQICRLYKTAASIFKIIQYSAAVPVHVVH